MREAYDRDLTQMAWRTRQRLELMQRQRNLTVHGLRQGRHLLGWYQTHDRPGVDPKQQAHAQAVIHQALVSINRYVAEGQERLLAAAEEPSPLQRVFDAFFNLKK
jgi:predicted component of type VI protein secretion system